MAHALFTGFGFIMCFSTRYSKSFPLKTVIRSRHIHTGGINCMCSHRCPGGGPTEAWLPTCASKHHHHRAFTRIHVRQSVSPKDTATETWFKPPIQWFLDDPLYLQALRREGDPPTKQHSLISIRYSSFRSFCQPWCFQTFQPDELFVFLSTHLYVWLSCCARLRRMRSNQISTSLYIVPRSYLIYSGIGWIKLQRVVSGTQPEQSRHFFF